MSLLYRGGKKLSILEVIEHAEYCLNVLKNDVLYAGEDPSLSASAILTADGHGKKLSTAVAVLQTMAKQRAGEAWEELYAFLDNHQRWPKIMFWSHFHTKLKTLGKASVDFRKVACFVSRLDGNGCTLFHEVCKLKPPTKVVQTMIDITPPNEEQRFSWQYNHLGYTFGEGHEYPLHMALRFGGSLNLVKLLVSADEEGDTFTSRSKSSLYNVLVGNRDKHKPKAFSEILRYLVLSTKARSYQLTEETGTDDKTPVGLLAQSLKEEGLSNTEILQNEDFAFLLRATCNHHRNSFSWKEEVDSEEKKCTDIEAIPLDRAFLVCCPCFDAEFAAAILEEMASADKGFLLEKDAADNDRYPLHHILESRPSYSVFVGTNRLSDDEFKVFIVETILRLAPEAAKQWSEEGCLPLHIAADGQRGASLRADNRLSLVDTIWKAYPDALGLMDKELSLPPFALPTRAERSRMPYDSDGEDDAYTAFSSTYFLLRQQPEMLAEAVASCSTASAESAEPSAKRQRTNSTKACN